MDHRLLRGRLKKSTPAIPASEPSTEIGIVILGGESVVDLMLGGTKKPSLYRWWKAHPDMAVSKVSCEGIAEQADAMNTQYSEFDGGTAEKPVGESRHNTGCDRSADSIKNTFNGVNPVKGQGREHLA